MTLEMRDIAKSFGANDVLKGVGFSLGAGGICALLGENGAGKSTLMNILGGVLPADRGEIFLDGAGVRFKSPAESLNAGIAFIHQELNLINDLAVYENMYIGRELRNRGVLDTKTMKANCGEIFAQMGIELDPGLMVRELDASYKQIVEIARALLMKASIIIMDEPTTSLTEPEIQRVFAMMRTLKEQGVGMVFISHKLREVMDICTDYTVLRDGSMVASGKVSDTTTDELARHMVGHDVRTQVLSVEKELGEPVLEAARLSLPGRFRDVSFTLHKGEVLGFTGLLGDGRSELFQTIFGCNPGYKGEILIEGKPVNMRTTAVAMGLGIGYVPRNRKENGIIKDMDILDNGTLVTLKSYVKGLFIRNQSQEQAFSAKKEDLHIKMGAQSDLIGSLSGGNQQKVVLAKWLNANPRVLVFDNPTQGVDVGAKEEIYDIILSLAQKGVAVAVLSSEAQEIMRICDRCLVLFHGQITGELSREQMDEQLMMKLATGSEIREEQDGNGSDK